MFPFFLNGPGIQHFVNRRVKNGIIPPVYFHIFCLIALFLFPRLNLPGQTRDSNDRQTIRHSSVYRDFEKEMEHYENSGCDSALRIPVSSALPSWFEDAGCHQDDTIFIPGISDPGLPDTIAKQQAFLRACALCALSRKTSGRCFSDYYLKNVQASVDSKYEEIYQFTSLANTMMHGIRIVRDTILRSKEAIMLVAAPLFPADISPGRSFEFDGYLYNYEVEVAGHNRMLKKIRSVISGQGPGFLVPDPDSLSVYLVNRHFTGVRSLQSRKFPAYDRFEYYYKSKNGKNIPDPDVKTTGSSCKTGLWIALVNQVFDQLSYFVKAHTTRVQAVNDNTQNTRIELNREKNAVNLKFTIEKIDLTDNTLKVQIKISHEK
mgnify:CR=1 FL=1